MATHAKSSTLHDRSYGLKSKFFWLGGLLQVLCTRCAQKSAGKGYGVDVPAIQLAVYAESNILRGRTVISPNVFGLMGYHYFV